VHATFTYSIPAPLRDSVRLGSRVEVPIGPKRTTGFVVELHDRPPDPATKLRPLHAVLDDDEPALIPEILELCRWAADYYLAPLGEMLRVSLPANMASRSKREVTLSGDDALIARALASKQIVAGDQQLLAELRRRPLPFAAAVEASSRATVERLRDAGLVTIGDRFQDAKGVRYDRFVVLQDAWKTDNPVSSEWRTDNPVRQPSADATNEGRTGLSVLHKKQQAALDLLGARGGEMSVAALEAAGIGPSTLSTLARKGHIRIERRARRHTLDAFLAGLDLASLGEIRHNDEQRAAIEAVQKSLGTFAPFLLEGPAAVRPRCTSS